jgi:hypothetical protein
VNGPFQVVYLPANGFQLLAIVRRNGGIALFFQFLDLAFDLRFINAADFVMGMHIDVERLAKSHQKVLLVHLRIALHRFVLEACRNFAKLRNRFVP